MPKAFIGSSTESLDVAKAIQAELQHDIHSAIWTQGIFSPSQGTIAALVDDFKKRDFAIFVLSPDDLVNLRKETFSIARDNVLLELGISIGILGLERTFWVTPNMPRDPKVPVFHIPTDMVGLTPVTYQTEHFKEEMQATLGPACTAVVTRVRELGRRIHAPEQTPILTAEVGPLGDPSPEDDYDYMVLIRSYIGRQPYSTPFRFDCNCLLCDTELNMPKGTTKRLIQAVAQQMDYVVEGSGNRFVTVADPPSGPTGNILYGTMGMPRRGRGAY